MRYFRCKHCLERMNYVPDLGRYMHLVSEHRESAVIYEALSNLAKAKFYPTSPMRATAWPAMKNVLHEVCVEETSTGAYLSDDA